MFDEWIKDAVLSYTGQALHWAVSWVMHTIGWPGIIAAASGCLLLLSLSAKAVKFLSSPKGMGVTAAVLAVSLLFMGWLWPKVAAAIPVKELADAEPAARKFSGPVAKLQATDSPVLASRTVSRPEPGGGVLAMTPVVPPIVVESPVAVPALPLVIIPHGSPAVTPKHPTPHHAPAKPEQHASAGKPVVPKSRPSLPAWELGQNSAAQRQAAQRQAAIHAQNIRARAAERAMVDRQFNMMMNQMMNQHFGGGGGMGGMHSGGMGHMGGMHHGGHR